MEKGLICLICKTTKTHKFATELAYCLECGTKKGLITPELERITPAFLPKKKIKTDPPFYIFHVTLPFDSDLGYDSYDEFIVVAKNEKEAREFHPSGMPVVDQRTWIDPSLSDTLSVENIGTADKKYTKSQVIMSSFIRG